MRRKAKVDGNQVRIVEVFRAAGCSVLHTHTLGKGAPDLIVAKVLTACVEVKDPAVRIDKQRLTPDEQIFANTWKGLYVIVKTEEDAVTLAKLLG